MNQFISTLVTPDNHRQAMSKAFHNFISHSYRLVVIAGLLLLFSACASNNVLTEEEIKIQNAADAAVAEILFERELEKTASYHVRKNGFVALHFDKSVTSKVYTEVVNALRTNPAISGVHAEQEGKEVCPLR